MTNPIDAVTALAKKVTDKISYGLRVYTFDDVLRVLKAIPDCGYTLTPIKPAEPQVELGERLERIAMETVTGRLGDPKISVLASQCLSMIRQFNERLLSDIAARGERPVPIESAPSGGTFANAPAPEYENWRDSLVGKSTPAGGGEGE